MRSREELDMLCDVFSEHAVLYLYANEGLPDYDTLREPFTDLFED
ncbi:hypothetical protein [Bifidobacterium magnum]|nr:hypothetical protein [Bifidobacterium magnum]